MEKNEVIGHLMDCRSEMVARLGRRAHAEEADDVVQEALLLACKWLENNPFTWQGREALEAWLWAFVERAHADRCKHHTRACRDAERVVDNGVENVAGRELSPVRHAQRQDRDERLRKTMQEVLTEDQRIAIELRHFEFLSVKEVAARMGWTESNVKMLCERGIARLREVLDQSMQSSGS